MLAPDLLHILQHSLGLNAYGQGASYRNHYVAGETDLVRCRELVLLGYMREHAPSELSGGSPVFLVTTKGRNAVHQESPPPPKRSRGQRRYALYLACDCVESFGQWLKSPYWAKVRADARV